MFNKPTSVPLARRPRPQTSIGSLNNRYLYHGHLATLQGVGAVTKELAFGKIRGLYYKTNFFVTAAAPCSVAKCRPFQPGIIFASNAEPT